MTLLSHRPRVLAHWIREMNKLFTSPSQRSPNLKEEHCKHLFLGFAMANLHNLIRNPHFGLHMAYRLRVCFQPKSLRLLSKRHGSFTFHDPWDFLEVSLNMCCNFLFISLNSVDSTHFATLRVALIERNEWWRKHRQTYSRPTKFFEPKGWAPDVVWRGISTCYSDWVGRQGSTHNGVVACVVWGWRALCLLRRCGGIGGSGRMEGCFCCLSRRHVSSRLLSLSCDHSHNTQKQTSGRIYFFTVGLRRTKVTRISATADLCACKTVIAVFLELP